MTPPIPPTLLAKAEALIAGGMSATQAAQQLGLSESGLRGARRRDGKTTQRKADRPSVQTDGDTAAITGAKSEGEVSLADSEALMRSRGFDPGEWELRSATVNEWEGPSEDGTVTYHQLKIQLAKRTPLALILPATDVKARPVVRRKAPRGGPSLVVVATDQQCPYHDPGLFECLRQFLNDERPARGVWGGDGMDFPSISRHRDNPAYAATGGECIQSFFEYLVGARDACEETSWQMLEGNHDERLRNEQLQRAERVYGIGPAQWPGEGPEEEALSLKRLLHLDRLGIEYVRSPRPDDRYFHAYIQLAPKLAVEHGDLTSKDAIRKVLESSRRSVIYGHTHRQKLHAHTVGGRGEPRETFWGCEAGTGARIEGGLGYTPRPDWQPGFATAWIWPDGQHQVDLARYDDGRLYWGGKRWSAAPRLRRVA